MTACTNLERCGWNVDYIVSHCCPTSIADFFEEIKAKCKFRYWLFGHYHDNEIVDEKFTLLYEQILRIL